MKRLFKKYEFLRKSDALRYIEELWVNGEEGNKLRKTYTKMVQDENGDLVEKEFPYVAHTVTLGFLPIEEAQYDENGNIIKDATLSKNFSVDVMWESDIEDRWNTYEVQPEVSSHKFA